MTTSIRLEKASLADLEKFAEMEQQQGTEEFVTAYEIEDHKRCFSDPSVTYLRIENAGRLVGFFILALDEDKESVEFRRVVVVRTERGIGQIAIQLMEQYCKQELKRKRIWLDVFETNTRGWHIYEKLGFHQFDNHQDGDESLRYYDKVISSI